MKKTLIFATLSLLAVGVFASNLSQLSKQAERRTGLGEVRSKHNANIATLGVLVDAAVVTATTNARVATVTITAPVTGTRVYYGWLSEAAAGASTATSLTSIVAGANTVVIEGGASTAPAVSFKTHTTGAAILTVTVGADVTRYFNVKMPDGTIASSPAIGLAN